jgi:hypothetical protein
MGAKLSEIEMVPCALTHGHDFELYPSENSFIDSIGRTDTGSEILLARKILTEEDQGTS